MSFFSILAIGLLAAWLGFIPTVILLLSWCIAGLPLLCISPSTYTTVATCLALIACMFGAGLFPGQFALLLLIIALIVGIIVFIIGQLATLVTTIISPCLPKIWLQWPYRLLLGGLRLAI